MQLHAPPRSVSDRVDTGGSSSGPGVIPWRESCVPAALEFRVEQCLVVGNGALDPSSLGIGLHFGDAGFHRFESLACDVAWCDLGLIDSVRHVGVDEAGVHAHDECPLAVEFDA